MIQRVASGCEGCHALPAKYINRRQTVARPLEASCVLCAQQLSSRGTHSIPSTQASLQRGHPLIGPRVRWKHGPSRQEQDRTATPSQKHSHSSHAALQP